MSILFGIFFYVFMYFLFGAVAVLLMDMVETNYCGQLGIFSLDNLRDLFTDSGLWLVWALWPGAVILVTVRVIDEFRGRRAEAKRRADNEK